ncbi:regulatory protein abaA [Ceratobasidium sp. AG-Ba]|nr:regulatory protein abaA [Ceratobasidium sp. AG-Ba]
MAELPINSDNNKIQQTWPPPTHHYSPYAYPHAPQQLFPVGPAQPRTPSTRRAEFAIPAVPHRSSSAGALGTNQLLAHDPLTSVGQGSSIGARRGRRPYVGEKHDAIWSPEVQEAFLQAARTIPNNGKNWIMRDGRQYGRNALIAEEIFRLTGQQRTRQQISSHIQVLKKVHADDPAMMRVLNGQLDDLPTSADPANQTGLSGSASSSASPPVIKTEDSGSSVSPPPTFPANPIRELVEGSQSFMSIIRSDPPHSKSESLPTTPRSSGSNSTSQTEPLQLAELLPRHAIPTPSPLRALSEPLVAELDGIKPHPGAWRGERLAYVTAITIWAERTLEDAGVRSRPTTTHVYAQMHSARCPLEPLPADMEDIVRTIAPGTCMHAEIGIALPPAGLNVGKIRATLVIEAMKEFDGYCLTDAFSCEEGRFMSTHTTVFPTGREAREKYSWTYEIPYATDIWRRVLTQNPQSANGMRLVQKYVRSLAGGNPQGDVNVALMVVHDVKVVPPGEAGYSRIKHVDLTGEQAKHDAVSASVTVNGMRQDDDESESSTDASGESKDGSTPMDVDQSRPKPNLSVDIPPPDQSRLGTRHGQLAMGSSQPVTPFEQVMHTPQQPPPLRPHTQQTRPWLWAPTPTEAGVPGSSMQPALVGGLNARASATGDGGDRMAWVSGGGLGTPKISDFAGRDEFEEPGRIGGGRGRGGEYF